MSSGKMAQIPLENIEERNLLREYDGLVGLTLLNINAIAGVGDGNIYLSGFHANNKEHLFVLRVALMARDLYQRPVYVDGSWWDVFKLNWHLRKGFKRVKRIGKKDTPIDFTVNELLSMMRPDGEARCGKNFTFTDIYEKYYEGSCN